MKWKTLQHNGILFPPDFESKGIKIGIRGENVPLNLLQEEMVYQWSKKKDAPKPGVIEKYIEDPTFQKNFVSDFSKAFNGKFKNLQYADIDFSMPYKLVDKEKEEKELLTKEDKKALAIKRKEIREEMKTKYGKAIIDGKEVEVGNYMAEPPGIFMGRGDHPMRGRYKPRAIDKDVTLNLGKEAKIPKGNWGKIVHDRDSMWIASWMDILTQKRKYVWLADTAGIKQERDQAKYDKARNLAKEIESVKTQIVKDMQNKEQKTKRIATACYLIYRTAMRVGDEKDPDEADTVGATTLRKEHVKLSGNAIEFDFLGKDSVRWKETIPAEGQDKQFHDNLRELISNKKDNQEIFDDITSRHVNAYYSTIVKGLTAKVFRTYLASNVVSKYLREYDNIKSESDMKKILLIISIILFSCNQDTKEKLVVYQSPTCGCCSGWVSNMEQNGFNVESIKTNDMYSAKVKAGIDYTLQSCHTAFIGNYFVEGHVPSDAITKLLLENPDIKGITVPGMPAGSNVPGMETINERAEFDVLAVNHDGSTFIWKKYQ